MENMESKVSSFIQRLMVQKHITGLSVALVDDHEVLFEKGYGFADRRAKQAAGRQTVYKIGSITKLFTGMAAMQLYEKGLLDIDKPVIELLPEFSVRSRPDEIAKITPRNLMTHHSGLPADWYAGYWNADPRAFQQVIEYLHDCRLAFSPNTVFSYSNLGMSLLGVIIERVSQLSYQDYIKQNILAPLKMTNTTLMQDAVPHSLLSKAYAGGLEVEDPTLRDAPAGAIFSNVQDMSRFGSMVLAGGSLDGVTILGSKTLTEMLSQQNVQNKLDLGFQIGLNWMLGRPALTSAGRVSWHDGGSPHFFSMLIVLPDVRLGVVVLSNSDGGMINVGTIADEILKNALEVKAGKRAALPERKTDSTHMEKSSIAESPLGTFATANGIVKIFGQRENLTALMQGMKFSLTETGADWYALRLKLFGILPIKIGSLESLRLTVRAVEGQHVLGAEQYGFHLPFGVEYVPVNIPASWLDSLGTYRLITQDLLPPFSSLRLNVKDGVLILEAKARKAGKMSLVLRPVSDSEAVVLGFGRVGGVTVSLVDQNNSRVLRMVGLEFEKS
jgi:CubicO group peptidase (beta-lactamase class C family)